jgi:hypothetical protein
MADERESRQGNSTRLLGLEERLVSNRMLAGYRNGKGRLEDWCDGKRHGV